MLKIRFNIILIPETTFQRGFPHYVPIQNYAGT
jgi:hypothetical protein